MQRVAWISGGWRHAGALRRNRIPHSKAHHVLAVAQSWRVLVNFIATASELVLRGYHNHNGVKVFQNITQILKIPIFVSEYLTKFYTYYFAY